MRPTLTLLGATRGVLTSKQGNKNFYKGHGSGRMGRHTPKGYILEPWRERTFVVPDLSGFKLKPYIDPSVELLANDPGSKVKRYHSFRDYFKPMHVEGVDTALLRECQVASKRVFHAIAAPKKPLLFFTRKPRRNMVTSK